MRRFGRWLAAFLILSGLTPICAVCAAKDSRSVVVETASGRTFTGRLDGRTTRQVLMLRSGDDEMCLVRPIAWNRVARVQISGQSLEGPEALKRFSAGSWPGAAQELSEGSPRAPMPPGPSDTDNEERMDVLDENTPPLAVRSLSIEATVAKWQSGAENDGVMVRIYPLDAYGGIVPVSGTLEVEVIGERGLPQYGGEPFPRLVRWVTQVRPQDVGPNGATYRVPFLAWHPEFDLKLGSTGAVHARLSVPGQGMFNDTATMVWLRPLSTTRDRLQQHTGGRFFPEERTNRGMEK